jgi:hypothetical protein
LTRWENPWLSGDIFTLAEVDAVAIFGGEISMGHVFDLDHPFESGIYFSVGNAVGANWGAGVGGGYAWNDIEGFAISADANLGDLSLTGFIDEQGRWNGGAASYGIGVGASISGGRTWTLSPRAIVEILQSHSE